MKNLFISWSRQPGKETFLKQLRGIIECYEKYTYLGIKPSDMQLCISPLLNTVLLEFAQDKNPILSCVSKIFDLTVIIDNSMEVYSMELKIKRFIDG